MICTTFARVMLIYQTLTWSNTSKRFFEIHSWMCELQDRADAAQDPSTLKMKEGRSYSYILNGIEVQPYKVLTYLGVIQNERGLFALYVTNGVIEKLHKLLLLVSTCETVSVVEPQAAKINCLAKKFINVECMYSNKVEHDIFKSTQKNELQAEKQR